MYLNLSFKNVTIIRQPMIINDASIFIIVSRGISKTIKFFVNHAKLHVRDWISI